MLPPNRQCIPASLDIVLLSVHGKLQAILRGIRLTFILKSHGNMFMIPYVSRRILLTQYANYCIDALQGRERRMDRGECVQGTNRGLACGKDFHSCGRRFTHRPTEPPRATIVATGGICVIGFVVGLSARYTSAASLQIGGNIFVCEQD